MKKLFTPNDLGINNETMGSSQVITNDFSNNPWNVIKEKLKSVVEPQVFDSWITPLSLVSSSETEIVLAAPSMIFFQKIHNEYVGVIESCKSGCGFDRVSIRFEISSTTSQPDTTTKTESKTNHPVAESHPTKVFADSFNDVVMAASEPVVEEEKTKIPSPKSAAIGRSLSNDINLNPNYTFDSYVKGDSNQFAVATCLSAADNPGKAYNPLFIYGSTGLGKTHLLHAVGNRVLQRDPDAVVCYISSERFMNEMIYCIRFNKMWDFRKKYRNCSLFLVDDIQFISGKKSTQEEFFHTFNTLYGAKKQIVITSDLFPKDIPDIEDRLRNRFQWGLIADIQTPSIEHRIAILFSKAEKLGIRLSQDVAEYIAKHAKRNVRELEGALHRINAFSALQGEPITMDLAIRTFKHVLGEPPKRLTIEHIQRTVADHFKLRVADLKSKKRQRAFAHPRQIAMYLSRTLTNSSFPEIGDKFGGKDHTTVMHNVKKIQENLKKDLDLKAHIESLQRRLEQL